MRWAGEGEIDPLLLPPIFVCFFFAAVRLSLSFGCALAIGNEAQSAARYRPERKTRNFSLFCVLFRQMSQQQ